MVATGVPAGDSPQQLQEILLDAFGRCGSVARIITQSGEILDRAAMQCHAMPCNALLFIECILSPLILFFSHEVEILITHSSPSPSPSPPSSPSPSPPSSPSPSPSPPRRCQACRQEACHRGIPRLGRSSSCRSPRSATDQWCPCARVFSILSLIRRFRGS